MVVDWASGTSDRADTLTDFLPGAEVVVCEPADIHVELEKAAARARSLGVRRRRHGERGGGGRPAPRPAPRGPPGGTLNHFAYDLGVEGPRDLSKAVKQGDAVRVDAGRFRSGGTRGIFLNTPSPGSIRSWCGSGSSGRL